MASSLYKIQRIFSKEKQPRLIGEKDQQQEFRSEKILMAESVPYGGLLIGAALLSSEVAQRSTLEGCASAGETPHPEAEN